MIKNGTVQRARNSTAPFYCKLCLGLALILSACLIGCEAPLQFAGNAGNSVTFNLNYNNQISRFSQSPAVASGSRLLLPMVNTLVLTVTDSQGNQTIRTQSNISGTVTFSLPLSDGTYSLKVQALDGSGVAQFTNTGNVRIAPRQTTVNSTIYLLPVNIRPTASAYSGSVAAGSMLSFKYQLTDRNSDPGASRGFGPTGAEFAPAVGTPATRCF